MTEPASPSNNGSPHSSPYYNGPPDGNDTGGTDALHDIPVSSNNQNTNTNNSRIMQRSVSKLDAVHTKTGVWGSASNLINSIVGAGIIGIPFAMNESGLLVGMFLLILVGLLTDFSLRLIVNLATFSPKVRSLNVVTFEDLMSIPYGTTYGRNFILISMFILAYGAMVAYLLIIKDSVPKVLGFTSDKFVETELIMAATSFCIMVPLSMMRDISSLALSSFISVTADLVLVVIVVLYSPVSSSVSNAGGIGNLLKDHWINGRLFIGLGVLSTAMACQHSAFLISNTLHDLTKERWAKVTRFSLTIATLLSTVLGVWGYLGYLDETQGDILNNFETGSRAVNGARTLLSITMFLTYPMEALVARHCIAVVFFNGSLDGPPDANGNPTQVKYCGCLGRREALTLLLYFMALVPALIVDDLGPVLSITGSLGASSIAYIAPGLVFLGINGEEFLNWVQPTEQHGHDATTSIELPVVGDATATMTTTSSSQQAMHKSQSRPWWWCFVGMPFWVGIASAGRHGTRVFLSQYPSPSVEAAVPKKRDFILSIFLICFGVIAAVCGFASNIYVQVNNVFFTPA